MKQKSENFALKVLLQLLQLNCLQICFLFDVFCWFLAGMKSEKFPRKAKILHDYLFRDINRESPSGHFPPVWI